MDGPEFFKRFAGRHEIGRDITDAELSVFYDDGTEVGLWRHSRGTTIGTGSVLGPDDAEMARYWFRNIAEKNGRRQSTGGIDGITGGRQR
jgi:hypothetical protein